MWGWSTPKMGKGRSPKQEVGLLLENGERMWRWQITTMCLPCLLNSDFIINWDVCVIWQFFLTNENFHFNLINVRI